MRTLVRGTIIFLLLAVPALAETEGASYYDNFVKPNFVAYINCAKQHMANVGQRESATSFEQIEGSLRPACGSHIDRARAALTQAGLDRSESNQIIRTAYNAIQPELRSIYYQSVSYERQRRQSEREEVARQQRARESEAAQQQQQQEVAKERDALLNEAAAQHNACLMGQMKEIVPFSNEGAETLAQVIITKCADAEKKFISLGVAFYGASKADLKKIVKDAVEERKKHIVADIVSFRASVTKELMTQPKQGTEAAPTTKPANGI